MPSLERITTLCTRLGQKRDSGAHAEFRVVNEATTLLLAVGSLDRRLSEGQLSAVAGERVAADLQRARSALQRVHMTLHTRPLEDARDDILEARGAVLDATSVLLGAVMSV